jgi:hypothetical protein
MESILPRLETRCLLLLLLADLIYLYYLFGDFKFRLRCRKKSVNDIYFLYVHFLIFYEFLVKALKEFHSELYLNWTESY